MILSARVKPSLCCQRSYDVCVRVSPAESNDIECGESSIGQDLLYRRLALQLWIPSLREWAGEPQICEAVDQDGNGLDAESMLTEAFVFEAD